MIFLRSIGELRSMAENDGLIAVALSTEAILGFCDRNGTHDRNIAGRGRLGRWYAGHTGRMVSLDAIQRLW